MFIRTKLHINRLTQTYFTTFLYVLSDHPSYICRLFESSCNFVISPIIFNEGARKLVCVNFHLFSTYSGKMKDDKESPKYRLSWQCHHRHPEQSEKYHFYEQSLEEINIISGCLLNVSKAWNRHVIFRQYNIIS